MYTLASKSMYNCRYVFWQAKFIALSDTCVEGPGHGDVASSPQAVPIGGVNMLDDTGAGWFGREPTCLW